jgi:hypothetical protein
MCVISVIRAVATHDSNQKLAVHWQPNDAMTRVTHIRMARAHQAGRRLRTSCMTLGSESATYRSKQMAKDVRASAVGTATG